MSVRPQYLLVATVVGVGLYFAGVPLGTLVLLTAVAYMVSMHLGGHGGHGEGSNHGHGGCGGGVGGDKQAAPGRTTNARPPLDDTRPSTDYHVH